uniref:F-box protein n=1 Tax=Fagus sylvatica TaxID=28930 RepID=A0A2N9GJL2_FAGSY
MATLQAASFCSSSSSASFRKIKATLHAQNLQYSSNHFSLSRALVDELNQRNELQTFKSTSTQLEMKPKIENNTKAMQKLYQIMEIVADRVEMHKNIGTQRDNWNRLLLTSLNGMTVTAATMAALVAISGVGVNAPAILALKLSSTLLYMAVTGISLVMNKIQPSQLAEEQRNATRLFKQLHEDIQITLALQNPISEFDVEEAMKRVLALDKAYPLPLLGTMLEKFPKKVEPAVWWPQVLESKQEKGHERVNRNGWDEKLEEEMREIVEGLPFFGSWGSFLGVVFGALAIVVNTLEHGGQVGMVFEMYRDSAGFFRLMEETIESNLKEGEVDRRENGELFEVKVALKLGRSLSELRDLASTSSLSSTIAW